MFNALMVTCLMECIICESEGKNAAAATTAAASAVPGEVASFTKPHPSLCLIPSPSAAAPELDLLHLLPLGCCFNSALAVASKLGSQDISYSSVPHS